jgi:leucyl aminopeptidase
LVTEPDNATRNADALTFPNAMMTEACVPSGDAPTRTVTIHATGQEDCAHKLDELNATGWAASNDFSGRSGQILRVPGADGALAAIVLGTGDDLDESPFLAGTLAGNLPDGVYALDEGSFGNVHQLRQAVLGFLLSSYRFNRYRLNRYGDVSARAVDKSEPQDDQHAVQLVCPASLDRAEVLRFAHGVAFTRDLINTPANDMGPAELESAARMLADHHGAAMDVTEGEALLAMNLPMIHAVGRASDSPPRLIDIIWGDADAPKLTLVGKGVIFDTGGLDLKPSQAMRLMKKDMGGAANVLGLAHMIMDAGLPVRLRVLIPAVENAVSGNAFRPGDILSSRKGLSVEIGNTDAEGRLVLGDALTLACEEEPDLIIDMATLTGAARVALGPDLPALFCNDDELAHELSRAGLVEHDPVWRLPLHKPYAKMLDSKVADTNNISSGGFAGAITAALFLQKFVAPEIRWAHLDVFSWANASAPGKVEGGEAQAIRALFATLNARYSK